MSRTCVFPEVLMKMNVTISPYMTVVRTDVEILIQFNTLLSNPQTTKEIGNGDDF